MGGNDSVVFVQRGVVTSMVLRVLRVKEKKKMSNSVWRVFGVPLYEDVVT